MRNQSLGFCNFVMVDGKDCVLKANHSGPHQSYTPSKSVSELDGTPYCKSNQHFWLPENATCSICGLTIRRDVHGREIPFSHPKIEYKIVEFRLYATESELTVLGDEGWQLVSESLKEDVVRYVFSRVRSPQ